MTTSKYALFGALAMLSTTTALAGDFIYKPASATEIAAHHQKVAGSHRERFVKPYEVQRLSQNVYWISVANYNVTAVVGQRSVLLIDAPHGTGKQLLAAIKSFTNKPLHGIVYSHAHADHVGDSRLIQKALADTPIEIYATAEVRDALHSHKVTAPALITQVIGDTFDFEGHTFKTFSNFNGHTQDNTALLIQGQGRTIIHAIDLVHPDQLEFRSFSNVEDAIAYKNDIDTLMALDWDVMVTGHSNLGYKADVQFVQDYIRDVQTFIHEGLAKAQFAEHFKGESPFSWYAGYTNEIIDFAHVKMAEKYRKGREEEFDIVAKSHVRVMFWAMFARAL